MTWKSPNQKSKQYHFGMKAHIGVDGKSGLVHSVADTAANVADVTQADMLLHGEESTVSAAGGYTGIEKRAEHVGRKVIWQIATRRDCYRSLRNKTFCISSYVELNMLKLGCAPGLNIPSGLLNVSWSISRGVFVAWPET